MAATDMLSGSIAPVKGDPVYVDSSHQQKAAYPDDLKALINDYLEGLWFSAKPWAKGLEEAMRYAFLAGGKRIRPVLMLGVARSIGADPRLLLPGASAIELVHTNSLIADDLPSMDNHELRRGEPTVHKKYGEGVAILAGVGLCAAAFRLITSQTTLPAAKQLRVIDQILDAVGIEGMAGGQYLDITNSREPMQLIRALKTGTLIECAVRCVLIIAPVNSTLHAELERFARQFGELFQLVDDLLDATAKKEVLGRRRGSDRRLQRRTQVTVEGPYATKEMVVRIYYETLDSLLRIDQQAGRYPSDLKAVLDYVVSRVM